MSLTNQFRTKKMSCLFLQLTTYLSNIYYTNTESNQITGIYWQHKTTLYDKFCHICHQRHWNVVSKVRCTMTFDPTRCYLVGLQSAESMSLVDPLDISYLYRRFVDLFRTVILQREALGSQGRNFKSKRRNIFQGRNWGVISVKDFQMGK